MSKTLVSYVHYCPPLNAVNEDNFASENLKFFLKFGMIDSKDVHYNFIINSRGIAHKIKRTHNVNIIWGHNEGYDYGGYKQSLDSVDINNFQNFIFVNDTCRGPFLPKYMPKTARWTDCLSSHLSNKVKMVGPTILSADYVEWLQDFLKVPEGKNTHIQSYCFALDLEGLNILLEHGKFDTKDKHKLDIIRDHEIGCSQLLLNQGFEIKSLQLSEYSGEKNPDINYEGQYFGTTVNPLEIMFIKTNRINDITVKNYTSWLMNPK